jgi:opacity protein-like surface antigen
MNRQSVVRATLTLLASLITAVPAFAGQSSAQPGAARRWNVAVSGIAGGSLPLTVNGLRVSDPAVPLTLKIDGGRNKKAPVVGGRISAIRRTDRGIEWGVQFDLRTFRYDGKAGVPTRVTGTVEGMTLDEVQISTGDNTRVTMAMGALIARMPFGRTAERPMGRWTPYVGIGGGNQHAHIMSPEPSFTTNAPTFGVLGGVEIAVAHRVGVFTEYRYEHLKDQVTMGTSTVNLQLRTNHVAGGITFRF